MASELKREYSLSNGKRYVEPVLRILKENGGELSRVPDLDEYMPTYAGITEEEVNREVVSQETGDPYRPYEWGRNSALIYLRNEGLISYERGKKVFLTQKGRDSDLSALIVKKDISTETKIEKEIQLVDNDNWRKEILQKLTAMNPYEFESFVRGLLKRMGFEIDSEKGIKCSGDGGIDGYGYNVDEQSLRTTRVALQCKRYALDKAVGSPEINNLRGAVDTHRAEYGVFITISYFSSAAKKSARKGGTPITLIDGKKLVDLMVKYDYRVQHVEKWVME